MLRKVTLLVGVHLTNCHIFVMLQLKESFQL